MNSFLAVIPARSGSKRVVGKNKKKLGNKPLIAWSLEQINAVDLKPHVVVSTDDTDIVSIAKKYKANPIIRSAKYATDVSTVIDAVLEVLEVYESKQQCFDAVLLLQPTSPFRTSVSIQRAIELYKNGNGESVVSVNRASTHPHWCKTIENGVLKPFDKNFNDSVRSQDLPDVYQLNGSIYLSSVKNLKERRSFYSTNTQALIIDSEEEALDIDTPFDWLVGEAVANKRIGNT